MLPLFADCFQTIGGVAVASAAFVAVVRGMVDLVKAIRRRRHRAK
jgi:hypothetical protein